MEDISTTRVRLGILNYHSGDRGKSWVLNGGNWRKLIILRLKLPGPVLEDCGQEPSDSQAPNTISRTHQSLKADRIPMNLGIFRVVRHGKHDISRVYLSVILYIYHHIICVCILIYIYTYIHMCIMGMVKPRPVDTCWSSLVVSVGSASIFIGSSYPPLLHLCMADFAHLAPVFLELWLIHQSRKSSKVQLLPLFLRSALWGDRSWWKPRNSKGPAIWGWSCLKRCLRNSSCRLGQTNTTTPPPPLVSANNDNAVFARGSSHLLGLLELNIPVKTRDLWGNAAQIYEKCLFLNLCSTSHEMTPFLSPMFCLG